MVIKDIPREYLALKINFCRQQLEMLPEVKVRTRLLHGIPTEYAIIGDQRIRMHSKHGQSIIEDMKLRDYYLHQLQIYDAIWSSNYHGELLPECKPRKIIRTMYQGSEKIILDKDYFDRLPADANYKYGKPSDYLFNGTYYRSAAEQEAAMFYTEMGIPFKYEPEVLMSDLNEPIYPDFVLYIRELDNCKFHDHFGVKQSSQYLKATKFKYANCLQAGLVPDTDYIFTHDTSNLSFDVRTLAAKLNEAVYTSLISST